jgi:serine protease Do
VERHGPLVRGVCLRVLGNAADADDAFQATFLVLVRNARSIRQQHSLAPWLHGVARRIAHKSWIQAARRHEREQAAAEQPGSASPAEDMSWRELPTGNCRPRHRLSSHRLFQPAQILRRANRRGRLLAHDDHPHEVSSRRFVSNKRHTRCRFWRAAPPCRGTSLRRTWAIRAHAWSKPAMFSTRFRTVLWSSFVLLGFVAARADDPPVVEPLPAVFSKRVPESIDDLKAIERHVDKVLARVTASIVCVRIGNSSGTGVIITKDGYVLTAGHVSGASGRDCTLIFPDGKTVKARTLGRNNVDAGMIKIAEDGKDWPFVDMGDSAQLNPGDWCIARGHPGGFKKGRQPVVRVGRILKTGTSALVHDCVLVGGDSGGPLFDMSGKVIGIESRIGQSIEANVAVPVNVFRNNWEALALVQASPGTPVDPKAEAGFPLGYIAPAYAPDRPITANGFGAEKAALGPHPNVLIFARELSDPLADLVRRVDEVARDKTAHVDSFLVLLGEGKELDARARDEMEGKLKGFVEKHKLQNTTVSAEPAARVESFRVSKLSDITLMISANGVARGWHTFKTADFKAETAERALADLRKISDEWKAKQK